MTSCRQNADYLAQEIEKLGMFEIISSDNGTPLVTFKLKENIEGFTVFDLERKLREYQWIVPAYQLADGAEDIYILRTVVRESFSQDLAAKFVEALSSSVGFLQERYSREHPTPSVPAKKSKGKKSHKAHGVC
eukprot:NODE_13_length_54415_cov_0.522424.p40 type:complete len:133 gc:universal NODE_13_length_54415_cov_0.522424:8006-7608(-)